MSKDKQIRIGLLVGEEKDWPKAFTAVMQEKQPDWVVEFVKLGFIHSDAPCPYTLIIDRMSHNVPFYRAYLKHAALQGCYVINNPFTWGTDSKLLGSTLVDQLGFQQPRTVALPNKYVEAHTMADSFRNLAYPLNWQALIDHVGLPAILKETRSGGRRLSYRVSSLRDLLNLYEGSGALTMVLQQFIVSDMHIHGFATRNETVQLLRYNMETQQYSPDPVDLGQALNQQLSKIAQTLTKIYRYDVNMVEFVIKDKTVFVTNGTNPAPIIDKTIMSEAQFKVCVQEIVNMVITRIQNARRQTFPLNY